MPPRPPKKHLFPRHGCVFCRSTIYKRYNFNTHLDTHLVEVTENSNNIAALEDGNHFVPLIAAVRRRSQRHIAGIPELRPSEFDGCHSWKLFTLIYTEREERAFKSRRLRTTSEWEAEGKRFLLLGNQDDAPDSFVPFEEIVVSASSSSDTDSDDDVKSEPAVKTEHPAAPVYTDSIHQPFGRNKGVKIVFNNLAQADNVGAKSAGQSALNRNRYTVAESSKQQHRDLPAVKPKAESSNHANQYRPPVKTEAESSSRSHQYRPAVKPESSTGYDFATPRRAAPIDIIDLRTPEIKREDGFPTVLVLRGVAGSVVVPAGMSLKDALALVSEKIGERVLHLRDSRGVVGEERWIARPVGEWKVAVEWAW